MMTDRARSLQPKLPENVSNQIAKDDAKAEARGNLPDFKSLMSASNMERQKELEAEKNANQGGELRLGENKSDREMREMLEKITGKKQEGAKNKLEKDDYLNLMITQLKHQDPTKPMDNQEMATQMAQFNSVEQLMGVNKQLEGLKQVMQTSGADKVSGYIGKDVEIAGNALKLEKDKGSTTGGFHLAGDAGTVVVNISDANGNQVRSLAMGQLASGDHQVHWDGKNDKGIAQPTGEYKFSVAATTQDGKAMKTGTTYRAKVDGVVDLQSGGKLQTANGAVELKDVVAVRNPAALAAEAAQAVALPGAKDALPDADQKPKPVPAPAAAASEKVTDKAGASRDAAAKPAGANAAAVSAAAAQTPAKGPAQAGASGSAQQAQIPAEVQAKLAAQVAKMNADKSSSAVQREAK